jgi:hypothetical protein
MDYVYDPARVSTQVHVVGSLIGSSVVQGGDGGEGGFGGGSGGDGGDAQGGGIYIGEYAPYGGPAAVTNLDLTVVDSTLFANQARGGGGGQGGWWTGAGGAGGDAQGGGIMVDDFATLALDGGEIVFNYATGGAGADPDGSRTGIGGGVFLSGPGSTRNKAVIWPNFASTSDPDVHGDFS